MPHKRRQPRPARFARPSVLGDGLPERLRSTSVALIGVVAAVGLVMVGLTLQHVSPLVSSGPIPEAPAKRQAATEPKGAELKRPARAGRVASSPARAASAPTPADPSGAGAAEESPRPVQSTTLVTDSEPAAPRGGAEERPPRKAPARARPATPAAPAAPQPAVEAPTAAASSQPPPAAAPPRAEETAPHPGNGNAHGKGNGKGAGAAGAPPGKATSAEAPGHSGD